MDIRNELQKSARTTQTLVSPAFDKLRKMDIEEKTKQQKYYDKFKEMADE